MPATYLSHQAPVLALVLWRPRWFDSAALVFGSMAPDWAYVVDGTRWSFDGHAWGWVLLFCTPAAALASVVTRRQAPALDAVLPGWVPLPGSRGSALPTVLLSAFLGAASHVLWDDFTHNDRWAAQHIAWFRDDAIDVSGHSISGAQTLQYLSTVLGAVATVALLVALRRRGRLVRHPDRGRPGFWVLPAVALAAGVLWALTGPDNRAVQVNRVVLPTLVSLAVAGQLVRPTVKEPA